MFSTTLKLLTLSLKKTVLPSPSVTPSPAGVPVLIQPFFWEGSLKDRGGGNIP